MTKILATLLVLALAGCASFPQQVAQRPSWTSDYTPSTSARFTKELGQLVETIRSIGGRVEFLNDEDAGELQGAFGHTHKSGLIHLYASMPVDGQFETLAHEGGHLFHSPWIADYSVREVFAELVGIGVQQFYGKKDAKGIAAGYLANHKHAFASLPYLQKDIDLAVKCLTGQATCQLALPKETGQ